MSKLIAPLALAAALLAASLTSAAEQWGHYVNDRFGVEVDIPPGFSPGQPPTNGDGLRFSTPTAELSVFGSLMMEDGFSREVSQRMRWAEEAGWSLSYRAVTPGWATWSGTQGARILYARAIPMCEGMSVGVFELVYYEADVTSFAPIIERLAASLADSGEGWQC